MAEGLIFPERWYAAGVVTPESAADFARLAAGDSSKSARYWYWLAFRDFTEEHGPLTTEQCVALHALGRAEPDTNLGGAIMAHIRHERACPRELR